MTQTEGGSMLEKLARAAAKQYGFEWDDLPEDNSIPNGEFDKRFFIYCALAMLQALRNPTPEMIEAMAETPGMKAVAAQVSLQAARGYPLDGSAMAGGSPLEQAWRAGIDKAMEGGE